jgi:hypothetical protein
MAATQIPTVAQPGTPGDRLLKDVLRSIRPLLQPPPANVVLGGTSVVVLLDPVSVSVDQRDFEGVPVQSYDVPGSEAVARAVGEFVTEGLNHALTARVRARVQALLDAGASLTVFVDVDNQVAVVQIIRGGRAVWLFGLALADTERITH